MSYKEKLNMDTKHKLEKNRHDQGMVEYEQIGYGH